MKFTSVNEAIEVAVLAVMLFAAFVNFVLRAVACFNLARHEKIKHRFFAFVPFLQYYLIGSVCDGINDKNFKKTEYGLAFLISGVLLGVPSVLSCFFSDLPLFTFNLIDQRLKMLNYLLCLMLKVLVQVQ